MLLLLSLLVFLLLQQHPSWVSMARYHQFVLMEDAERSSSDLLTITVGLNNCHPSSQSAVLEEEEEDVHDPDPLCALCVGLMAREDSRGGDSSVQLYMRCPGCCKMLLSPKEL